MMKHLSQTQSIHTSRMPDAFGDFHANYYFQVSGSKSPYKTIPKFIF